MSLAADLDSRELATSLFQPDVLLPAQYFEKHKKIEAMPERVLMRAVLEDAVCCFQKYLLARDRRGRRLFKETETWILDDDDSQVFSYRNICDVSGIDADYLRLGLLRWKKKRLAAQVYQLYKVKKKHRVQRV